MEGYADKPTVDNRHLWFCSVIIFVGLFLEFFYCSDTITGLFLWGTVYILSSIACVQDEKQRFLNGTTVSGMKPMAIFFPAIYVLLRGSAVTKVLICLGLISFMTSSGFMGGAIGEKQLIGAVRMGDYYALGTSNEEVVEEYFNASNSEWDYRKNSDGESFITHSFTGEIDNTECKVTLIYHIEYTRFRISDYVLVVAYIGGESLSEDEVSRLEGEIAKFALE